MAIPVNYQTALHFLSRFIFYCSPMAFQLYLNWSIYVPLLTVLFLWSTSLFILAFLLIICVNKTSSPAHSHLLIQTVSNINLKTISLLCSSLCSTNPKIFSFAQHLQKLLTVLFISFFIC